MPHSLDQSAVKPKPILPCLHAFFQQQQLLATRLAKHVPTPTRSVYSILGVDLFHLLRASLRATNAILHGASLETAYNVERNVAPPVFQAS